MAIAFVSERYSAGFGAIDGDTDVVSGSFTPAADALLVYAIHTSDGITSISGHDGGGSWVQIGTTLDVSGRDLEIWACHTGSSPSAGTVTIVKPYNWNIAVSLLEFSGVDVSGTVTASFGTVFTEGGNDLRMHLLNPTAYDDPGNATLIVALGGSTLGPFANDSVWPPHFSTIIGEAGSNGGIGAAWFNYEPANSRVQAAAANWTNSGLACVEMKAVTPNTGYTKGLGNAIEFNFIIPEDVGQEARLIQFTVDEAGTMGSVWAALQHNDGQGATFGMFLYDSSGNLLDSSNTTDAPAPDSSFQMLEFTGMTYELEAATTYYLAVASDVLTNTRVCQTPAGAYYNGYEITSGFSNLASPPDPATIAIATTAQDYCMYLEYTPAAGGPAFPYHSIKQQRQKMKTLLTL